MSNYKCAGKILTTHGIKGDLKIESYSDFERFYPNSVIYIKNDNNYEKHIISKASPYKKGYLIHLQGYDDINLVLKYHGKNIYVIPNREEDLDDGEFYVDDLIGMSVYNQDDNYRGEVVGVRDYPHYHMLEINFEGKIALVPFIDEFIIDVDDKIIIKEIEGLF